MTVNVQPHHHFHHMTSFRVGALAMLLMLISCATSFSQTDSSNGNDDEPEEKWYDKFSIRGYVQVRYNRLLETNPDLKCEQCDESWGENGGFSLRRIRVVFSGQINKRVYFYVQPDFASDVTGKLHFGQLRDAYFDLGFDDKNEWRVRLGQSKIPYGFENMQSSQNRLPLDRNDGINSSLKNERDLGAFFYWAPDEKRQLFSSLVKDGLKGSGDYGVFAFGAFNGQTANTADENNSLHVVARLSYPFEIGDQVFEPGIQAYTGKYVMMDDQLSDGVKTNANLNYTDQRAALSLVLYPKPFGIQAEYNIGRGPEFNKATDSIEVKRLHGGYVTLSYMLNLKKDHVLIPFVRGQYYDGGKKFELDARSYEVREFEVGFEWQPVKQFELVAMYTISSRRFEDFLNQDNLQKGNLLRLQAQINF